MKPASRPAFIGTSLLLLALLPLAAAQGNGDAALDLARRLLGPWGDTGGMRVELSPHGLPDELPVELPLPDQLELLGSLANYGADGELMHAQIVLDSPVAPDETQGLLAQSFASAGWRVQEQGGPVGFTQVDAHVAALYCAPENEAFIHMNSFGTPEGITDVRLELNTQVIYSPCAGEGRTIDKPMNIPLPTLPAPQGSEITLHGGSYLEEQASSSAVVVTDMSADELVRHFEGQLEQAGWLRAPDSQPGQSIWTRVHEERRWRGVLSIIDLGGTRPQFYAAFVMVPAL